MSRDIIAYIDQQALRDNLAKVKLLSPASKVLAMIKSNGYGHGVLSVAKALSSAEAFGVACFEEAFKLRDSGIDKQICVMSGFLDERELREFIRHDLTAVIHHAHQLEILAKADVKKPLPIWVKLDTGMNRLGFAQSDLSQAYRKLMALSSVKKPFGVMTHLADADNQDSHYTRYQLQEFFKGSMDLKGPKSIANSAGIFAYPDSHVDWVRPGIMLYGVSPFSDQTGEALGLKPVMTLTAKLIAIHSVKKGQSVGYGCTWQAPEDMRVGVVAAGYGDGYPRHAPSGTPIVLRETLCPLVGRVSMDLITIDLRAVENAQVGEVVTLWGKGLPVERIARRAGTIGYELLCGVTTRVKFKELV